MIRSSGQYVIRTRPLDVDDIERVPEMAAAEDPELVVVVAVGPKPDIDVSRVGAAAGGGSARSRHCSARVLAAGSQKVLPACWEEPG